MPLLRRTTPPRRCFTLAALFVLVAGPATLVSLSLAARGGTTLRFLIEREDDIDISCDFILRGLRYVRFHKDDEFGRLILPAMRKAADWLASRDREGSGLPQGDSFWYDWKDVPGVSSRKCSPYASMIYVAATRRLAEYCGQMCESPAAGILRERSQKALALLNRPVADGGLWNGRFDQPVWRDGRDSPQVLEDQVAPRGLV